MEWRVSIPNGSYSVSGIQDYFEYTIKNHERVPDNPSIMIYINKIENRIMFKMKTVYYLELLIHCNIVNILSTTTLSKIQESCTYLFLINRLVNY